MDTVQKLLDRKATERVIEVITIEPDATVLDAVRLMAERDIGSVAVLESERLVGMLTERHYARNVILAGRRSDATTVREVMSETLVPVAPEETVDRCMALMTEHRIRHLPVMQGERLVAVVSIGDLVRSRIAEQEAAIEELTQYIQS